MKIKMLAAAALLAVAPVANAEGFYADAGYSFLSLNDDGLDVDVGAITAHAGYEFNPYFAVEGEAGFGVDDDNVSALGVNVKAELESMFGLYARGQYPVTPDLNVFGRVGVVQADVKASALGFSESADDTGFAFGAGGEYTFANNVYLRGEYTRHEIDDLDADVFGLSVGYKFGAMN